MNIIKSIVLISLTLVTQSNTSYLQESIEFATGLCRALQTDDIGKVLEVGPPPYLIDISHIRIALAAEKCKNPLIHHLLKRWGLKDRKSFLEERQTASLWKATERRIKKEHTPEKELMLALQSDDIKEVREVWQQLPASYKEKLATSKRAKLWVLASSCRNPLVWHQLKRWGFDPHAFSKEGTNSLMDVVLMEKNGGIDCYETWYGMATLIQHCHVKVDAQNTVNGKTAFMYAVEAGLVGTDFALENFKADPTIRDWSGKTALNYAELYLSNADTESKRRAGLALVKSLIR